MLLVLLFVYFARVECCPFSLPLGVRDWLRRELVALPGLSIKFVHVVQDRFETCADTVVTE